MPTIRNRTKSPICQKKLSLCTSKFMASNVVSDPGLEQSEAKGERRNVKGWHWLTAEDDEGRGKASKQGESKGWAKRFGVGTWRSYDCGSDVCGAGRDMGLGGEPCFMLHSHSPSLLSGLCSDSVSFSVTRSKSNQFPLGMLKFPPSSNTGLIVILILRKDQCINHSTSGKRKHHSHSRSHS